MAKMKFTTVKILKAALNQLDDEDVLYPQQFTGDLIILNKDDVGKKSPPNEPVNFKVFSFDEQRIKEYSHE